MEFPSPDCNVSLATLAIANELRRVVREYPFLPFNTVTHLGLWRLLLVKESHRTNEVQVIIALSKDYEATLMEENKEKYKTCLEEVEKSVVGLQREGKPLVSSLYFVYCDSFSGSFSPGIDVYEHRAGGQVYRERVNGFEFKVSPQAFFQVNTPVFEEVLAVIEKWAMIE